MLNRTSINQRICTILQGESRNLNFHQFRSIFTVCKWCLGQGNVFTPVCHSVHRGCLSKHAKGMEVSDSGGCLPLGLGDVCLWVWGICLWVQGPAGQSLPMARHPWVDTPWADTPLRIDDHWSGWYASYWNAFLFWSNFILLIGIDKLFPYCPQNFDVYLNLMWNFNSTVSNECPKLTVMHNMSIVIKSNSWTIDETHNFNC